MYETKQGAKNKICPMGIALADITYVCQGDDCMAWRWLDDKAEGSVCNGEVDSGRN